MTSLWVRSIASFTNSLTAFETRAISGEDSPTFGHANAICFVLIYRQYKESISKEMNNDFNLHLQNQMSGLLRY